MIIATTTLQYSTQMSNVTGKSRFTAEVGRIIENLVSGLVGYEIGGAASNARRTHESFRRG